MVGIHNRERPFAADRYISQFNKDITVAITSLCGSAKHVTEVVLGLRSLVVRCRAKYAERSVYEYRSMV